MIFPKSLKKGDSIGVLATASPLSEERLSSGLEAIEKRGYKVVCPLNPSRDYGLSDNYWSNGSVAERREALTDLLKNPQVKAIITARGGYGTAEMLHGFDLEIFRDCPKPIVGLSDVTPLLAVQAMRMGVVSIHGPSIGSSLADSHSDPVALEDTELLFRLLSDPAFQPAYPCRVLRQGSAEGVLLAGNLSMFISSIGTSSDVDFAGAILVLEDVAESPFKIHRMLGQLAYSGKLDSLAGLVFGRFSKCVSSHGPSVDEVFSLVLDDMLRRYKFPVYSELPMGHWGQNVSLPLGCKASLTSAGEDGGQLQILESAVS